MTSPILGIDPGATDGGIALVEGQSVLAWWAWTWLKRPDSKHRRHRPGGALHGVYRLRGDAVGRSNPYAVEFGSMGAIGRRVRTEASYSALVLEMPFGGHNSSDLPTAIVLSDARGRLGSILEEGIEPERILAPLASEWRASWGWTRLSAEDAERAAVSWALKELTWPRLDVARSLPDNELGAVCEAACMAVFGARLWADRRSA